MTLEERIRTEMQAAMKAHDPKTNILKFILGEFQRRPNLNVPITDNEVIKIIQKFLKSYEAYTTLTDVQKFEIEVLSEYLPKQASEDEIKGWILANIELSDNKQARMKHMREITAEFAGRADGNTIRNILMNM